MNFFQNAPISLIFSIFSSTCKRSIGKIFYVMEIRIKELIRNIARSNIDDPFILLANATETFSKKSRLWFLLVFPSCLIFIGVGGEGQTGNLELVLLWMIYSIALYCRLVGNVNWMINSCENASDVNNKMIAILDLERKIED